MKARAGTTFADVFDPRANGLNFVRLLFATGVIVWHSFPLTGRDIDWWPLRQFLGEVWVDGFFAISGYLIVSSWMRDPHAGRYLRARVLRILPAFWVCLIVTAGVIAPVMTGMFGTANLTYVLYNSGLWMVQFDIAGTPAGVPYPDAWNGSLWTLAWEFLCYLGVLVLGVTALLRRRWTLPVLFALAVLAVFATSYGDVENWYVRMGARFGIMFLAGALVYRYASRIRVNPPLVVIAVLVVLGALLLPDYRLIAALPLAYLALVAGAWIRSPRLRLRNDISYGVYIYAFPLQQVLAILGLTALVPFMLLSILATIPVAAASWFLVEKPALRWKKSGRRLAARAA